jgi:hypothetical protein
MNNLPCHKTGGYPTINKIIDNKIKFNISWSKEQK